MAAWNLCHAGLCCRAIVSEKKRSLGQVVRDLILQSMKNSDAIRIRMSDHDFPVFRCLRPLSTEDVNALDDE